MTFDDWQFVESSNINAVRYDEEHEILEVEFTSGGVYRYFDVGQETYADFLNADSHGKFFYAHIRNQFEYERVN